LVEDAVVIAPRRTNAGSVAVASRVEAVHRERFAIYWLVGLRAATLPTGEAGLGHRRGSLCLRRPDQARRAASGEARRMCHCR
jgi:hypothetical protein